MNLADFQLAVAQTLGVVPVSGSLSIEDLDVIQGAYTRLMMELNEHRLVTWSPDEDVPDTYADIVLGMTAALCVDAFVIAEPRRSQIIGQYAWGLPVVSPNERRLRSIMRHGATGEPVIEYF